MPDLAHSHAVAWQYGQTKLGFGDGSSIVPQARGLLIGECPGPNTDARLPLFPFPNNSAAARLLRYAGIAHADWMGKLVRMNMCEDAPWSERRATAGQARALAYLLDKANYHDGRPLRVLLLGRRVADAWRVGPGPFGSEPRFGAGDVELQVAWVPHPSGRNLLYNARDNQLRARRAVLWAIGERPAP